MTTTFDWIDTKKNIDQKVMVYASVMEFPGSYDAPGETDVDIESVDALQTDGSWRDILPVIERAGLYDELVQELLSHIS